MIAFAFSGCAFRYWFVPLISGTHWKLIVRFGRGSFPSLISFMIRAADLERQRAAGVVVVGALLDDALVEVAADRDFLRRAAVAGNLGVHVSPSGVGTCALLTIERIVTVWPRVQHALAARGDLSA